MSTAPTYVGAQRASAAPVGGSQIARASVAVFTIALLTPTVLFSATRATRDVVVAEANEILAAGVGRMDVVLPNQVAGNGRRFATPEPAPPVAVAPDEVVALITLITASWYGPGFYENRLPCWQWLQANGYPIQFLPDTWGVAHKTLPCGTMLVLTHGVNTITVPVVDRGPYVAGREIDMSPRVKAALGCTDLCTVVMQIE
jgi:Lytic transglycolase